MTSKKTRLRCLLGFLLLFPMSYGVAIADDPKKNKQVPKAQATQESHNCADMHSQCAGTHNCIKKGNKCYLRIDSFDK